MNKEDEFPYGYIPSRVGLLCCFLLFFAPFVDGMLSGRITHEWIYIGIFYVCGFIASFSLCVSTNLQMYHLGNTLPENGKRLLKEEWVRYFQYAIKWSILWPVFLFRKE